MGIAWVSMNPSEVQQTGEAVWYSSLSTSMASGSSSSNTMTELFSYLDIGVIRVHDVSSFDILR